jgi:hypothetical protein
METVFDQLDRDWIALIRRPSSIEELSEACALAGASSPLDFVPTMRRADWATADAVLIHLAHRATAGSEVANRAILQLLVSGTCRLAAKWRVLGTREECAAAAVAAVFSRIRRYPLERRPRKIAANILMDANQDLARMAREVLAERDRIAALEPSLLAARPEVAHATSADELRELIDDAIADGRVPRHWAELIVATHIEGADLPTIARRTGTPVRTLQWRRRHAEAALVAGAAA